MDPYSNIPEIPEPFIFNCWKHHFNFIIDQIAGARNNQDEDGLIKGLVKIGNSQIDLYVGEISPPEILNMVVEKLTKMDLLAPDPYIQWIYQNQDEYQKIRISDDSWWTMKEGNLSGRHVHIHPGRYSPHTIRVKAPVLKTAITVSFLSNDVAGEFPANDDINYARTNMLDLPPIKGIMKDSEAFRVLELFRTAFRMRETTDKTQVKKP